MTVHCSTADEGGRTEKVDWLCSGAPQYSPAPSIPVGSSQSFSGHAVAAMFCDAVLGCWSIACGDKQPGRRTKYGNPGTYRPTSYGIEYRVMSNFWTRSSQMIQETGDYALRIARFLESPAENIREAMFKLDWSAIRSCILNENPELAHEWFNTSLRSIEA